MIKYCSNNRIILSVLILIGFSTIAGAVIPVTYTCCVNHTNVDGPQVDNFENVPMGGTQLENFEVIPMGGTLIDGFENIGNWSGEADTTNFKEGKQGLKLTVSNNLKAVNDSATNIDLSKANDFGIWIYIPDVTNFSYFRLYFTSKNNFNSSYFTYSSYEGFRNGWNKLVFDKSMFTNTNSESWNNRMLMMRVIIYSNVGTNTNATIDDLRYNVDNDWMVGENYHQADTDHFIEGQQGLKLGSVNFNRSSSEKVVNYDLSAANNLGIWLYVPDPTTLDFIRIYLTSSGGNWSSYLYASAYGGFKTGWNKLVFDKSMFINCTNNCSTNESWNNKMNRIKIAVYPIPLNNTNATVDDLRYGVNNDWLPEGSGYVQNDTTNVKEGLQGLKLVAINDNRYADGGSIFIDKVINQNFSDLKNFAVWVYVENGTNTNFVMMYLTSDPDYGKFLYSRQWSSVKQGWNKLVFSKNNFVNYFGNESWNNTMVRMRIRTASINNSVAITFDDLRRDLTGDRARLMFQFDDGDLTTYSRALPIMSKNNQTGVSFATTSFMEGAPSMDVSQLKVLQSAGWDVSSHTVDHPDLTGVGNVLADITPVHNETELISELNDSYDWLIANKFQKSAGFIAYPYGRFNDLVIKDTKKRYVLGRSTNPENALPYFTPDDDAEQYIQGTINVYNDTSVQSLKDDINDSINSKLLGLILFHVINDSIADPYDYLTTDFQNISDYVKSRNADADVITYEDLVFTKINNFTPVINKTTRIYANGSSVLITKNMYDEYMPNMSVVPSNSAVDITLTLYNESSNESLNKGSVIFNESSNESDPNNSIQVSYLIGDRKQNQGYKVNVNLTNGTSVQTLYAVANVAGYISYNSALVGSRYQTITPINLSRYNVSGFVFNNGSGLGNVSVQNGSYSNITNASGRYLITNVINGTYNFSYSKAGFNTGYLSVTINGSDNKSANVSLYNVQATYNVSGFVSNNGYGLGNVSVQNGNYSNITDISGHYLIAGLLNGTYNFSYAKTGFNTGYLNVTINGTDNNSANISIYNSTPPVPATHNVSGYAIDNIGIGLENVSVQNGSYQNLTDTSGHYLIAGLLNGTYNFSYAKTGFNTGYLDVTINGTDNNSANISIYNSTQPALITVLSPNGGENLAIGSTNTITWNSIGNIGTTVKIELFAGGTLNSTISSNTSNGGSYSWTIPSSQMLNSNYKIRVTGTNNQYTDSSDNNFTVSPPIITPLSPSITLSSPNGGENWARGTTHTITWSSTGNTGTNVKIELFAGNTLSRTISLATPNGGSYSWTVPSAQVLNSNYKIRVTSTSNPLYTDASNNNFSISGPSITLSSPNGGENWARGTTHTITWSSTGNTGTNVKIELFAGNTLSRKISSATSNRGSYSWTVPSAQALNSNYKIRVTGTNNQYTDSSNNNFTIS